MVIAWNIQVVFIPPRDNGMKYIIKLTKGLILSCSVLFSVSAYAIPSLQLSGDGSADWSYDTGDDTWIVSETNSFNLLAHANASKADGGNGYFAWDDAGATNRYAYLIVAATPDLGMGSTDIFDISIKITYVKRTAPVHGDLTF